MQERNMAAIIASTEEWGIVNVLAPEAAIAAEEERRAKMLDDALPEARRGFPAELRFCWRPIHHHAGWSRRKKPLARTPPAMKCER